MTNQLPDPPKPRGHPRIGWPAGLIVVVAIAIGAAIAVSKPTAPTVSPPPSEGIAVTSTASPNSTLAMPPTNSPTQTIQPPTVPPTETPRASPTSSPDLSSATTGMRWDVGLAGFGERRGVDPPIAWHGGFADIEGKFNDLHLLISPDGRTWNEATIPFPANHGLDMVAFGSELVLADHHAVFHGLRYGIWMSGDGLNWRYRGSVTTRAVTPGYDIGSTLVALGNRLGILAFIGPPVGDGGVRPAGAGDTGVGGQPASGGAVVGRGEIGAWVWTSADGRTWRRQRVNGAGKYGIQRMVVGPDGLAGFRSGFDTGPLMRSSDGINWTRLAGLPDAIDPSTVGYLAATDDGYIVVTLPYAPVQGDRPLFSIWRVSKDGVFTHVLDRPHAEFMDIQTNGAIVVITANEGTFAPELPFGVGFALVSTDSGATFQLSAGWPAMRSAGCVGSAAIHDRVVIAETGCNVEGPAFLRAELP